ncbi:uncharacterized protein [Chironomus tepperi]|uniref:uncharacterized protein n=1 Tax=Chironomus tepperi TaxID=113505 RepID=UPI00391F35D6
MAHAAPPLTMSNRHTKPYQSEFCIDSPNAIYVHEECNMFYYCDDYGHLAESYCPDQAPIFDYYDLMCMTVEEGGICWQWVDHDISDEGCPSDPYEVVFLAGQSCTDYYICMSGRPVQLVCAPGLHWNERMGYCDYPANAQCDVSSLNI